MDVRGYYGEPFLRFCHETRNLRICACFRLASLKPSLEIPAKPRAPFDHFVSSQNTSRCFGVGLVPSASARPRRWFFVSQKPALPLDSLVPRRLSLQPC